MFRDHAGGEPLAEGVRIIAPVRENMAERPGPGLRGAPEREAQDCGDGQGPAGRAS